MSPPQARAIGAGMKTYGWIRTLFLSLFAIGVTAATAWHWFVDRPLKQCEAKGGWYDPDTRVCAQPFFLSDRTGRPLGQQRTPEQVAAGQESFRRATSGETAAPTAAAPGAASR